MTTAPAAVAFLRKFLLAMAAYYHRQRLDRRFRFYAAAYMLLGASFILRGADSAADAVIGFLLWVAAAALLLLSATHHRFPAVAGAAARLAQAALEPLFELLN